MKRVLQNVLSALVLTLVLASCQDLTGPPGPQGETGKNGLDAPLPPDIGEALSLALAAKTGGTDAPYAVKISGLDLSDSYTVRQIFHGVAAGIPEGDINLDLSECTGAFFGYNAGISSRDRARFTGLTLPDSLAAISDGAENFGAFAGFTGLKRISAPGLLRVGNYAFCGCAALETLDLPQVTAIGRYGFAASTRNTVPKINNTALARVDLPQVETIGEGAFYHCITIAELILPEVLSIGLEAFSTTSGGVPNTVLETVDLPKAVFLDLRAFEFCNAIKTINLPNAGEIGASAFAAAPEAPNTALESVSLPEAGIIVKVFAYCTALTNVDLPVAASIGNNMFLGCTSLTTVNAPEATSVGDSAFEGCTSLVSLELPRVRSFGNAPFKSCTSLTTLKLGSAAPPTRVESAANGLLNGTGSANAALTILAPNASLAAYNGAGWVDTAANNAATGSALIWGTNHKQVIVQEY
jgi:hypothetical protein